MYYEFKQRFTREAFSFAFRISICKLKWSVAKPVDLKSLHLIITPEHQVLISTKEKFRINFDNSSTSGSFVSIRSFLNLDTFETL
jgi:hypothetical protein